MGEYNFYVDEACILLVRCLSSYNVYLTNRDSLSFDSRTKCIDSHLPKVGSQHLHISVRHWTLIAIVWSNAPGLIYSVLNSFFWTIRTFPPGITHIAQLPPQNILRKNICFCTGFPQASSRMQNDIIRSSSGRKNVRFTASWGAPREFPKSIPKEGLRKITGTNMGEIKETSRSHGVLGSQNASFEILRNI